MIRLTQAIVAVMSCTLAAARPAGSSGPRWGGWPRASSAGSSRPGGAGGNVDPTEFGFGLGVVSGLFLGVGTGVFLVCVLALRDAWLARAGIYHRQVRQARRAVRVGRRPRRAQPPIECISRSGWMNRAVLISCPSHFAATLSRMASAISASVGAAAEQAADVGLVEREEAVAELAVGGEANPVAAHAEGPADRGDQADAAPAVDEVVIDGRRARVLVGGRGERADLGGQAGRGSRRRRAPCSRSQRSPASSGMYSMNRSSSPCSRANRASGTTSSSVTPRIATALILTGSNPAALAARIPSITCSKPVRRVSSLEPGRVHRVEADVDPPQPGVPERSGPCGPAGCRWSSARRP